MARTQPELTITMEDVTQLVQDHPQVKVLLENIALRRRLLELEPHREDGHTKEDVPKLVKKEKDETRPS